MTKQEEFDSIVEMFEGYKGMRSYEIHFLIERVRGLQAATCALDEAIRWIGRLNDWEGAGDPDIDTWRDVATKAKGEL